MKKTPPFDGRCCPDILWLQIYYGSWGIGFKMKKGRYFFDFLVIITCAVMLLINLNNDNKLR